MFHLDKIIFYDGFISFVPTSSNVAGGGGGGKKGEVLQTTNNDGHRNPL